MKARDDAQKQDIEYRRSVDLPRGVVEIVERETHETLGCCFRQEDGESKITKPAQTTRLVIDGAVSRTKNFVSKARSEIGELSAILQELTNPHPKAQ